MKRAYEVQIIGLVQGIGFRPFVFREAVKNSITGWVKNQGGTVYMHIEGDKSQIQTFIQSILKSPPPLSQIQGIRMQKSNVMVASKFIIETSRNQVMTQSFLPVDMGVCDACLEDIRDQISKRYQYAFTNCTACGPRYTILKELPYDRQSTTMEPFWMCLSCRKEYEDSSGRRFHAQPNCCSDCGPELFLCNGEGVRIDCNDSIQKSAELLKQGFILAIKGLGGYHLCCDAMNKKAAENLRKRKKRPHQPFAIMASDISAVKQICDVSIEEESILSRYKRPIVLLRKKIDCPLASEIAPNLAKIGVMLPYTPLHYLLLKEDLRYLIMTSGNIHDLPICYTSLEAHRQLKFVADYFLEHNREIYTPIDDSVVKLVNHQEQVSRLARGYAPRFIKMKGMRESDPILGVGAEQKSTFSLLLNGTIHTSPYIGDLEEMETYRLFVRLIQHFQQILHFTPVIIAHDKHPDYMSTYYANHQKALTIPVQHHHAHMVSCMAEHQLLGTVMGVIYDGTGFGLDGAVWGGEFFVGTRSEFQRVGHLQYTTLQGGSRVIKEIWRSAVCYLWSIGMDASGFLPEIDDEQIHQIQKALVGQVNCFTTSSIGRLFDAVAALAGIQLETTYDAQGAIELEAYTDKNVDEVYPFDIVDDATGFQIQYEWILKGVLVDRRYGKSIEIIATKFHHTIIQFTIDGIVKIAERYGIYDVVLSGGVFENSFLLEGLALKLREMGFRVFHNEQIPINDSGISFGQVVIAEARLREGKVCV